MGKVELLSKGKRWVLLSLVVPQSIDINLRRELFSCSAHQIVGCEPCVRKVLKQSPTSCQLVTRHITHIYPIFNPESEQMESFCPRWIFPSLWHTTKNDFSGGLFLHDKIDLDVLHKYEKELQQLEEKEEKMENREIVTQGSPWGFPPLHWSRCLLSDVPTIVLSKYTQMCNSKGPHSGGILRISHPDSLCSFTFLPQIGSHLAIIAVLQCLIEFDGELLLGIGYVWKSMCGRWQCHVQKCIAPH